MLRALARVPWWAQALIVWAASRVVTTAIMLAFAAQQRANAWTPASPGYLDYATMWDAHWYFIITQVGYPSELPLTADGHVDTNAWAFMPVYPMLARVVMLTGVPWEAAAVGISLAASAGFAVVMLRLFRLVLPGGALFATTLVLCSPLSPVLQLGYAESLHLLLLASALLAWVQRDWWMLGALVPVMALARPSGLAFAFALALWIAWQCWRAWRSRRGAAGEVSARGAHAGVPWQAFAMTAWAAVWGMAWFVACWIVTGDVHSYLETELRWRADYIGRTELVPFSPWVAGFAWWFGPWGILWLALLVVGVVAVLAWRGTHRIGTILMAWVVAYLVYLLAVWFPQSSTWRILMPVFPLAGAVAIVPAAWARAGILLAAIALQPVWIWYCWQVVGADWTVP